MLSEINSQESELVDYVKIVQGNAAFGLLECAFIAGAVIVLADFEESRKDMKNQIKEAIQTDKTLSEDFWNEFTDEIYNRQMNEFNGNIDEEVEQSHREFADKIKNRLKRYTENNSD